MKKNLKNYLLIIVVVLFSCNTLRAQDGEIPEINLPGADAVSLMIPIDNPVSLYKGIPDITIPLYTVQCRNFKLPISISYQASGVKVSQEASCVGLGWSLNAGGMISRVVKDVNDFGSENNVLGFFWDINNDTITHVNVGDYMADIGNPMREQESDLYYFNFCGYSGKFVLGIDDEGDEAGIIIDQGTKLKIKVIDRNNILIVDDFGVEYVFQTGEQIQSYSKAYNYRFSDEMNIHEEPTCFSDPYVSKWVLKKVTLPTNEEILFNYSSQSGDAWQSITSVSRSGSMPISIDEVDITIMPFLPVWVVHPSEYNYSFQRLQAPTGMIEEIIYPGGKVRFHTSDREDCGTSYGSTTGNKAKKLTRVEILRDFDTIPVKTWDFVYSYFNMHKYEDPDKEYYLRLKLESVGERGIPPYRFTYNESRNLPAKNAPSFDHWGYYNGEPNMHRPSGSSIDYSYILPEYVYSAEYQYLSPAISTQRERITNAYIDSLPIKPNPLYYINKSIMYEGAIRRANEEYAKTAVLEKITFPTGGTREFVFESNDYYDPELDFSIEEEEVWAYALFNSTLLDVEYFSIEDDFVTNLHPGTTTVNASSYIMIQSSGMPDYSRYPFTYYKLYKKDENNVYQVINAKQITSLATTGEDWVENLSKGDYKIAVLSDGYISPGVALTYTHIGTAQPLVKKGGGLRIKSIIDNNKKTYYSYKENILGNVASSGKLLSEPQYCLLRFSGEVYKDTCDYAFQPIPGGQYSDIAACRLYRSASSVTPAAGHASTIGYSTVTEYTIIDSDTLATTSRFINEKEVPYTYRLPNMPNRINHNNGLLTRRVTKKNNQTLKVEEFNYEKDPEKSLEISRARFDYSNFKCHAIFKVTSEWWKMASQKTTEYFENDSLVTFQRFEYNDKNYKIKEQVSFNSKQDSSYQEILYTIDVDPARFDGDESKSYIASSVTLNKNMVSYPVRTESLRGNRLIGGSFIYYNDYGQVDSIYKLNTNSYISGYSAVQNYHPNNYDQEKSFLYDNLSNNKKLLEYTTKNEFPVSFVWGYYDNTLPIAKIENAHYSEVSPYVSSLKSYSIQDVDPASEETFRTALNTFRSNLPNAMVSTYTYDPLVGMTSSTDPSGTTTYYEYDSLNRLVAVLNKDKDIVQNVDYHYYEQPFMDLGLESYDAKAGGDTINFDVLSSTVNYTISENSGGWLTVVKDGYNVTVNCSANTGATNRLETITFTNDTISDQLVIRQDRVSLMADFSNVIDFNSELQSFTIPVTSNAPWTVSLSPVSQSAISIGTDSGNGNGTIRVTCEDTSTTILVTLSISNAYGTTLNQIIRVRRSRL